VLRKDHPLDNWIDMTTKQHDIESILLHMIAYLAYIFDFCNRSFYPTIDDNEEPRHALSCMSCIQTIAEGH
jgi:hypothetical protein